MTRTLVLAVAAALVAAACSGSAEPDILVVADLTGVVTIDENGAEVQRLGTVGEGVFAFQPTWSRDGRYVAYSEWGDTIAGDFVISGLDGSTTRLERATRPYYFSWDPGGARVVTLRNLEGGGGILVESVTVDGTTEEIDRGAPYYFAWAPDGGRYLLHVEQTRIEEFTPGAGSESLGIAGGAFQAPSWDESGRVYIRSDGGRQVLVLEDANGARDLAEVGGLSQMVAAGGRVAIQVFGSASSDGNGQSASYQQLPRIDPGALYVVDENGVEQILDERAAAFFWSPDASKLLILSTAADPGDVRWLVWDGEEMTSFEVYGVEPSWVANFLPFFDQYATSMSLWKPDGTAFAFPGVVDGERGIWVQRLLDERPTKIADGFWVAWQPQP